MIISPILGLIPFVSNCDSTRLQMASKQITQSISHLNCNIPYVVSKNFFHIREESGLGIKIARKSGEVLFNDNELFIIKYDDGKIEFEEIPLLKKTHAEFCSELRYSAPAGFKFQKGDILWEYDSFRGGIPVFGYNVFSAYFPFFGFTFEDALVISENFSNIGNVNYCEKIYVPVYEYTVFKKLYRDVSDSLIYFPGIGQKLKDDILCCYLLPSEDVDHKSKREVIDSLSSMSISELLSAYNTDVSEFDGRTEKTSLHNAVVTGLKIHRIKKDVSLFDKDLDNFLTKVFTKYGEYVIDVHNKLLKIFPPQFANKLIRKYYVYSDKDRERKKINLDCVYLLEFEVASKNNPIKLGDKLTNRYAGKGVVSLIIPDELRPIGLFSNKPIDYIYNPMGVFSRMNVGQLIEGTVGKSVMYCDEEIREHPENTIATISWLNDTIIKNLNNLDYYNAVKNNIERMKKDKEFLSEFIKNVNDTNLYIYASAFAKINLQEIVKNGVPPNEPVKISKKLLKFISEKLKMSLPFSPIDIEIPNIFCVPIYISRLYKISEKLITARDYGPVKSLTKQPSKGRASSGGSKLGQMELEAILAHGCESALNEILTVKSDWQDGKKDLLMQIIKDGEYSLPEKEKINGHTKKIINVLLDFLS